MVQVSDCNQFLGADEVVYVLKTKENRLWRRAKWKSVDTVLKVKGLRAVCRDKAGQRADRT